MRTGVAALLCAAVLGGCVTTETVQFQPKLDQQSITRDGVPGIVSTKKDSIVIARPAARQFQIGGRPVFVLAVYNRGRTPQEFRVSNVTVMQHVNGNDAALKVITYEELVSEERTRQTLAAIGTGLAVAGNAMAASQAGYYHANSTVYAPRGGIIRFTRPAIARRRLPSRSRMRPHRTLSWSLQPSSAVRRTWRCSSVP